LDSAITHPKPPHISSRPPLHTDRPDIITPLDANFSYPPTGPGNDASNTKSKKRTWRFFFGSKKSIASRQSNRYSSLDKCESRARSRRVEDTRDPAPIDPGAIDREAADSGNAAATTATFGPNMNANKAPRAELPSAKQGTPERQGMQVVDAAAARALVKKLVRYQQSSGAFVFPSGNELTAVLGADFYGKLDRMRHVPPIIASTALVVALLEAQLESCRGLWLLMAAKAKTFVESQAAMLEGVTPAEVLSTAQRLVAGMRVLDLQEDGTVGGRRDSGEPVELLIAPVL